MTHMIRACSVPIVAALGLVVAAAPALAQNAPQCVVSGSPPAGWGFNSIGYIEIASGGSCMFTESTPLPHVEISPPAWTWNAPLEALFSVAAELPQRRRPELADVDPIFQ